MLQSFTAALPYIALGLTIALLFAAAVRSRVSAIALNHQNWQSLVSRLQQLNFQAVAIVARDYLEPHKGQLSLEADEIWSLVGGYEGLRRMRENAQIMLGLAAYAQQWNFEEGVIVAERMRRDALRLRWAVDRMEIRRGLRRLLAGRRFRALAPFDFHEAAACYYLMRQRLLALYETSHAGLYPVLAAAL